MPRNTVAQATESSRLLSTSAPSRLTGANSPPASSAGARRAKSTSEPPMVTDKSSRMNAPRSGSLAKVCTDDNRPERTMKVPISDSEKVRIASRMVQALSALRFSTTIAECNSAVPISQGMKETFSTGSQNHQPPQPSS